MFNQGGGSFRIRHLQPFPSMKHIIITIALTLTTITLSAKDLATCPDTGLTLSENLGVYTVTGKSGVLVLGNKEAATKFFTEAVKIFTRYTVNDILSLDNSQYEVKSDDTGIYLIKVGVGAAKIRPADAFYFKAYFTGEKLYNKGKKIWEVIKE